MSLRHVVKKVLASMLSEEQYASLLVWYWKFKNGLRYDYEPEVRLLPRLVSPGDWAIDIGVNFGQYATRLARLVGSGGRVIGFEAAPYTYAIARRVAVGDNVDIHQVAVSDTRGQATLVTPRDGSGLPNWGLTSIVDTLGPPDEFRAGSIPTIYLDDFLADRQHRIAFIKCDIEGHEGRALAGAREVIRRDLPALIVETDVRTLSPILELLGPFGYTAWSCDRFGNIIALAESHSDRFNVIFLPPGHSLADRQPRRFGPVTKP
jgi:FkbM family methyltransferase